MRVLVTGGAGFIGRHIVQVLEEQGHEVFVLDRVGARGDRTFVRDITNKEHLSAAFAQVQPEVVFHLAAIVGVDLTLAAPFDVIDTNVRGTLNVLETVVRRTPQARVFLASSSEIYGRWKSPHSAIREESESNLKRHPRWTYAYTKVLAEQMADAAYVMYALKTTTGRFFNVAGPGQRPEAGVLPMFVDAALLGRPIEVFWGGAQKRCFLHVKEAAELAVALTFADPSVSGVYNIGCPSNEISIRDLAVRVREAVSGCRSEILYKEPPLREVDVSQRSPDISAMTKVVGRAPKIPLDTIIEDVIADRQHVLGV